MKEKSVPMSPNGQDEITTTRQKKFLDSLENADAPIWVEETIERLRDFLTSLDHVYVQILGIGFQWQQNSSHLLDNEFRAIPVDAIEREFRKMEEIVASIEAKRSLFDKVLALIEECLPEIVNAKETLYGIAVSVFEKGHLARKLAGRRLAKRE